MRPGWHKLPKEKIDQHGYTNKLLAYIYTLDHEGVSIRELAAMFDLNFNTARVILDDVKEVISHSSTHLPHTNPSENGALGAEITQQHTVPTQEPLISMPSDQDTALLKQLTTTKTTTTTKTNKSNNYEQNPEFISFWNAYPKKKGKMKASEALNKIKEPRPTIQELIASIAIQKGTHDWQKDDGQFIPLPATWLNQRRWEDEIEDEASIAREEREARERQIETLRQAEEEDRRVLMGGPR